MTENNFIVVQSVQQEAGTWREERVMTDTQSQKEEDTKLNPQTRISTRLSIDTVT